MVPGTRVSRGVAVCGAVLFCILSGCFGHVILIQASVDQGFDMVVVVMVAGGQGGQANQGERAGRSVCGVQCAG